MGASAPMKEIVGIVLAGGQSRRFGEPKAFAKRDGKEFILYSVEALQHVVEEIVVVTRPEFMEHLPVMEHVSFIEDLKKYKGKGPLAGLFSAMSQCEAKWYIVLPCDTPFMNARMIKALQSHQNERWEAIVPRVNGQIQPLIAMYHDRVKGKIQSMLEKNELSMHRFLSVCHVNYVDLMDERAFVNINTKEEYERFIG
ncbi:molybdopterin-guanine dinucleotide biosynthesis protein A [Anoxybacillus flavithermus TNO-09.006]|nr:molybdenum cofactor guanylyltransferase [Anoxybacillus flavithermus]ELK22337.1 molybdopterin-guanine dinucleotide biosynthesis protein A [Anoxybacillus flavithermus TNO-09.006]